MNFDPMLRQIPKVDELIAHPAVSAEASHIAAAQATREVLDELRENILNGVCEIMPSVDELAARIAGRVRQNAEPSLRRLINATGVILHTNLGRAPLAPRAAAAVHAVAEGYSTLEYNVAEGARGSRHSHVEKLLTELTGAEAAMVVNNNAAAVLLALSSLASGKEVVVSRGELVEIGGAFRIPEVMEQSGCVLREVGATNRTRRSDYENAVDRERTAALLKAHTSNFKIVGFTEEVSIQELAAIGREYSLPVLYDLGSGSLIDLAPYGIKGEPTVAACIEAGADVVCFSGDKLLGGPQAGVIIGGRTYIERMKKHPLARALRIDKLTLAALEATLRLYRDPETAKAEIPLLRMLAADREKLREKARRLKEMLEPLGLQAAVTDEEGYVGGGSAPTSPLPSAAVEINPHGITVTVLEQRLRAFAPAIIARIARDRLLLDMRTVDEQDLRYIADCLISALGQGNRS